MNKLFVFGGILFLGATSLDAREIGFRPRLNLGLMNYDFTQPGKVFTSTESSGATSVFPTATSKWSASGSSLPMIRTGFTFFVERLFFDFDFQYAFNGHANAHLTSWTSLEKDTLPILQDDNFLRFDTQAELDFERTEFASTLGYSVTDQLSLYAGYKRADSETNFDLNGNIIAVKADDLSINPFFSQFSQFTAKLDQKLVYQGPFMGATYTWNTNKLGLEGALTGNVGLAFLEAESSNPGFRDFELSDDNGNSFPEDVDVTSIDRPPFNLTELSGNTVGLSLALTWNGYTPIEGLMYSVGLSSYQYDFEGTKGSQDFAIDVLRFDTGINYFFGF